MNPVLLGGLAVGGVLVLALAGWWLMRGRRPKRIENPEEAAAAAETLRGFVVTGAVVGADGAGAFAVAEDGRAAAIRRVGGRLVAREVAWRSIRSTAEGVLVETGDRRLGDVPLRKVDVLDIRRMAPRGTRL